MTAHAEVPGIGAFEQDVQSQHGCPFCQRWAPFFYGGEPCPDFNNGSVAVFEPLNPVVPGHLLVVPFKHVRNALTDPEITAQTMRYAAEVALPSCNLITSVGSPATQSVEHLHIHIVPRAFGDGLKLPWTPHPSVPCPYGPEDPLLIAWERGVNDAWRARG